MFIYLFLPAGTLVVPRSSNVIASPPDAFQPGVNRPIPKTDMRKIKTQLQSQRQQEQLRAKQREERWQADPWERMETDTTTSAALSSGGCGGGVSGQMMESASSSATEEFFSLDLNSSLLSSSSLGEPSGGGFSPAAPSVVERSPLIIQDQQEGRAARPVPSLAAASIRHGGLHGTSTLAAALPPPPPPPPPPSSSEELCRFSASLSGLTLVLLQTDPVHTHSMPSVSGRYMYVCTYKCMYICCRIHDCHPKCVCMYTSTLSGEKKKKRF